MKRTIQTSDEDSDEDSDDNISPSQQQPEIIDVDRAGGVSDGDSSPPEDSEEESDEPVMSSSTEDEDDGDEEEEEEEEEEESPGAAREAKDGRGGKRVGGKQRGEGKQHAARGGRGGGNGGRNMMSQLTSLVQRGKIDPAPNILFFEMWGLDLPPAANLTSQGVITLPHGVGEPGRTYTPTGCLNFLAHHNDLEGFTKANGWEHAYYGKSKAHGGVSVSRAYVLKAHSSSARGTLGSTPAQSA